MSNRRLTPTQLQTNRRRLSHRARTVIAATLLSGGVLLPGMMAWANSPIPGTVIENQATGSFVDPSDSSTKLIESNVVQVSVAEVAGITVDESGYNEPTDGTVNENDTVYFDFVITNVGNDPTQFVLPGAANITGGTANGDIQVIEYDPDGTGTSAVNLSSSNITVPAAGGTTGSLSGMPNNGSIPAGGSITVRVPVTAGVAGFDLTVTLGDTTATNGQNEGYVAGTNDVYTDDNTGTTNSDTDGDPINGEREASDSLTVAISTAASATFCPLINQLDNLVELDFENASRTLVSGTSNQAGAVYRFANIISGIDALVTVEELSATSTNVRLTQNGLSGVLSDTDGFFQFRVDLVNAGTNIPSSSIDLVVTTFDIDGNSGNTLSDFVEYINPNGYFLNSPTQLQATPTVNSVNFVNTNTGVNDTTNSPEYAAGAVYENTNSFVLKGGVTNGSSPATRGIFFRVSAASLPEFTELDCNVFTPQVDYGDAPDTGVGTGTGNYRTLSSDGGARHAVEPSLSLGSGVSVDTDGFGNGTDSNGNATDDNDDAFTSLSVVPTSGTYDLSNIPVSNTTGRNATLHGWIDFDQDGEFEPSEYQSTTIPSGTATANLSWSVPGGTTAGTTYARFRLTTNTLTDDGTTADVDERSFSPASDGEVEDYQVEIAAPSFDISGTLYVDSNGNDIFENPTGGGSEAPMPENITVRLLSSDGSTELATTVTDTNGSYSFPDIVPGTYQVAVETTDPDIPIGHNIGTPTPLTISLTSTDAIAQDFGFDFITTGSEVAFCQSPNGEVYSGGINRDIYAIYPSTGATFRVTNTALAGVVNSLATDHLYRVAYYAEGQAIYAWDPINDTHVRLQDSNGNLNVSAMPGGGSISSLTSGGAAFFNGSYYLGIERAQGNSNTEVYRVDFVPGSNGLVIQSLTALGVNDNTGGANGGLNRADWGDMIISDAGVIYGATRRAGFTWSFDLSTGIYNQISSNYLGQLAKDGEGVLWGLSDTSRIQQVNINTGSLFGTSSPTSSPIADMAECVVGLSTIGDRIWDDLDGDGVQDPLEPGIANVTVGIYRDLNGNGVIDTTGAINFQDPLLTTQVTNGSGNYDFVDLIRGNYIVKVLEGTADDLDGTNVLDGAVLTTTTTTPGGQQTVTIPLGINDYDDADFGYQLPIVPKDPNVLLVKRITQINGSTSSAGGDDLSDYIDQSEAINPYDDNDITVADPANPTDPPKDTNLWPTPLTTTLIGGIDGGNVMPNDEIEYTIYYLSSGDATAESVLFCDYVPTFTSFIPNAYTGSAPQATGGIGGADLSIELFRNGSTDYHTGANDGDSATYFAPGTDPATSFPGIDCDGDKDGINANTNGAVVVNLGDLPDAATDATGAYGYVRFRTRVK